MRGVIHVWLRDVCRIVFFFAFGIVMLTSKWVGGGVGWGRGIVIVNSTCGDLCCRETQSGTCGGLLLCYHHLLTGRSLKIM
jgi:mannose/fructose/N-acetylgalactosamine-specific phosphotransferase system component IID